MRLSAHQREDAFTLVEILVVILIVGVLTAVAVPAFLNQRKAAYDASLKSDLHNVSVAYSTWLAAGNTNKDYRDRLTNNTQHLYVTGEGRDTDVTNSVTTLKHGWWNKTEELPDVTVTDGTLIDVIVRNNPTSTTPENQFCITGHNNKSNYNPISTEGRYKSYARILYYSSMSGGISTMEEMDAANLDPNDPCYEHLKTWRDAAPAG